jgi:predicted HAD superfamily Cof-like phosphohydrolase
MGVDLQPFFEEVHRANMTKAGGPKREDGKQLKPVNWRPPDMAAVLTRIYGLHIENLEGTI